jgi:phosphohistidine phosphatase
MRACDTPVDPKNQAVFGLTRFGDAPSLGRIDLRRKEGDTMALYLVQHGLALPKEKDPQKGLSKEGRAQTERIAAAARGYRIQVSAIFHSGKARAQQTAQIFEPYLMPPDGIRERPGLKPLDDAATLADQLDLTADWMLVSHLPLLERLTSCLIIDNPTPTVLRFQNSGIVCIDEDPRDRGAVIKWALMPNID